MIFFSSFHYITPKTQHGEMFWFGIECNGVCNFKPCLFVHQEGKKAGELIPVAEYLEELSSLRYDYSVLQERPLPSEVDPLHLENYLQDEEFLQVLGMERLEFAALPPWKQLNMKRDKGLY